MRTWTAVLSFFLTMPSFAGQLVECNKENNTLAAHISGLWEYDAELSAVIGDTNNRLNRIRFTIDEAALKHFSPMAERLAENTCVYATGFMDIHSTREGLPLARPFVLTTLNGAPYIVWLERYGAEGFDSESFQVALAAGSDVSQDRLILGNDFQLEGESMKFLKRVPE